MCIIWYMSTSSVGVSLWAIRYQNEYSLSETNVSRSFYLALSFYSILSNANHKVWFMKVYILRHGLCLSIASSWYFFLVWLETSSFGRSISLSLTTTREITDEKWLAKSKTKWKPSITISLESWNFNASIHSSFSSSSSSTSLRRRLRFTSHC